MPSQFFGLNIAASGLRASNAALNTTANNIANAQTDGYSRQEVTQQASNALRTFTTYGCAGAGVDTLSTKIYTEVKKGIKPEMYALSTLIFVTVLILLMLVNRTPEEKRIPDK